MRASDGIAGKSLHFLPVQFISPFSEQTLVNSPDNLIVTPLPAASETIKLLQKQFITVVNSITKKMDICPAFKLDGKLNSRKNFNAGNLSGINRFPHSCNRIVVGDGDH